MRFKSLFITTLLLLFMTLLCISAIHPDQSTKEQYEWELIWEEDFNSDSLDTNVWGYMKRGRDDSRKYHSSNMECYEFKGDRLIIKGIKNPDLTTDTAQYLTGGITTQGKKAFTPPCRIEIKAKLGEAQGAWPAFWMLPFKSENGWPSDGEIDIMEHLNFDDFVYQTVHSSYTKADRNARPQKSVKAHIDNNSFNIYGVDIFTDKLVFYVNRKKTFSYPKVDSLLYKGEFPFNRDWYLMIDMQLGGSWVGKINSDDIPVEMEIDWVKYYRPLID